MVLNHQRMNRTASIFAAIFGIFVTISTLINCIHPVAQFIKYHNEILNYNIWGLISFFASIISPLFTAFTVLLAVIALFMNRKSILAAILFFFSILPSLVIYIPTALIHDIRLYMTTPSPVELIDVLINFLVIFSQAAPVLFFAVITLCCFSKGKLLRGKLSWLIGAAAIFGIIAPVLVRYISSFVNIIHYANSYYMDILDILAGGVSVSLVQSMNVSGVLYCIFTVLTAVAFMLPCYEEVAAPSES